MRSCIAVPSASQACGSRAPGHVVGVYSRKSYSGPSPASAAISEPTACVTVVFVAVAGQTFQAQASNLDSGSIDFSIGSGMVTKVA